MKHKYSVTINGYASERYSNITARNKEKAQEEAIRLFLNDLEDGKIDIEINDIEVYEEDSEEN